jgi:diguanylate cyclase
MINVKLTLYLDDTETEKIFSYLRWTFLVVATVLFNVPFFYLKLDLSRYSFNILLFIGILYMLITHMALKNSDKNSPRIPFISKLGMVFDFMALVWLMLLSGGVSSILFPVNFLIVMHATVFWRTKGAVISTFSITVACLFMTYFLEKHLNFDVVFNLILNLFFLWIIGLIGSIMVIRERSHFIAKEKAKSLLNIDYLTQLLNHRCFQEDFHKQIDLQKPFFLVFGDIDRFKKINDVYGHLVGDDVLIFIGHVFKEITIRYGGNAYRYGGEEFAFIFPGEDRDQLLAFMDEIYLEISKKIFLDDKFQVTVSFGICQSEDQNTPEKLMSQVDKRLYEAKRNGKNQTVLWDDKTILNPYIEVDKSIIFFG